MRNLAIQSLESNINSLQTVFIHKLKANNPTVGYNRWPEFIPSN
jgi:hypothetical protein